MNRNSWIWKCGLGAWLTCFQIPMSQWFRLGFVEGLQPFTNAQEQLQHLSLSHKIVVPRPKIQMVMQRSILIIRQHDIHLTSCVYHNIRIALQQMFNNMNNIVMPNRTAQFDFSQCNPFVFDAVACDSFQCIFSLRRCIFNQINQTESTGMNIYNRWDVVWLGGLGNSHNG